ncbi:MAG: hypothetical protein FWB77_04370 [Treponema sp.]|nr:hypothetical protein [Treponema sp.]
MKAIDVTNIEEVTAIKAEQLIGTKWESWCEPYRGRMSMEFIDKTNCVYISNPREFPMTYTVAEGRIYISNIEGAFELRGDVLFNNDLPVFERGAA